MMMSGMCGGYIWCLLLAVSLVLGFAYIIWTLAEKQKGITKILGQAIAIIIAVLMILILLLGAFYGNSCRQKMKANKMMMMQNMMPSAEEKGKQECMKKNMQPQADKKMPVKPMMKKQ
jgi:hypothetical protein